MSKSKKKKRKQKQNQSEDKISQSYVARALSMTNREKVFRVYKQMRNNSLDLDELLSNPEIEINPKDVKVDGGKHHSKDFVAKEGRKVISNDEFISNYIKDIGSIEYNTHKRNTIIVENVPYTQNAYQAKVYYNTNKGSGSDKGYGFKVEFTAKEKWKVIILTKLLKARNKTLCNFKVDIK